MNVERTAIVDWLRLSAATHLALIETVSFDFTREQLEAEAEGLEELADAIERGDHLAARNQSA